MGRSNKTKFSIDDRNMQHTAALRSQRVNASYQLGSEIAASYRIGDRYVNAWTCADARKITDRDERVAFIDGFLAMLPNVRCDERGRIVDLGAPKIFE